MPLISKAELHRRRCDILAGARRCFSEHGYEGATVRLLEEATGKSRGAIFHHFGDKESLFLALAREDTARQAELVASNGLVDVMREMLHHPERHDWLATRLEIASLIRTDPNFRERWRNQHSILAEAIRNRLVTNSDLGSLPQSELDALVDYLLTFLDGFIARLARGETENLDQVLNIVENSIRSSRGES